MLVVPRFPAFTGGVPLASSTMSCRAKSAAQCVRSQRGDMSELATAPASRLKSPSWLDGRMVVGVLLVLLSVAIGAKIVASSDRYDAVWAASHDIAAGSTLTRADLEQVKVRFHDHGGGYFAVSSGSLVGRTASQALFAGQLIPADAVPNGRTGSMRLVTLPVARLHMPKGAIQGMQVDLYVTGKSDSGGNGNPAPELVLANVTIADTISDSSGLGDSGGSGVVLNVPVSDVDAVVAAAEAGSVDLVRVPTGQTAASPSPGDFLTAPVASGVADELPGAGSSSGSVAGVVVPGAGSPASDTSTS